MKSAHSMRKIEVSMDANCPDDEVMIVSDALSRNSFTPVISREIRRKAAVDYLPPIVEFTLLAIAGGFLGGIGQDMYDKLKSAIKDIYVKYREKGHNHPNMEIRIESSNGLELDVCIPTDDVETLTMSLEILPKEIKRKSLSGGIWYNPKLKQWGTYEDVEKWNREGKI